MKKILCLILITLTMLMMFTACSKVNEGLPLETDLPMHTEEPSYADFVQVMMQYFGADAVRAEDGSMTAELRGVTLKFFDDNTYYIVHPDGSKSGTRWFDCELTSLLPEPVFVSKLMRCDFVFNDHFLAEFIPTRTEFDNYRTALRAKTEGYEVVKDEENVLELKNDKYDILLIYGEEESVVKVTILNPMWTEKIINIC